MELKDTIDGMLSDDYIERFITEYRQLDIRINKLNAILEQEHKKKLDFKLNTPIEMLLDQRYAMLKYMQILRARAKYEGINLD